MSTKVRALIVSPTEDPYVATVSTGSLQELVGGFLELVWLSHDIHAYVNEEGRFMDLPVNIRGSDIVNRFRQETTSCSTSEDEEEYLGTMIFLSMDAQGDEKSLTDKQLARIGIDV